MSVPPPLADPSHIETRLLVVAEMLDRAVAEVRRLTAELKDDEPTQADTPREDPDE